MCKDIHIEKVAPGMLFTGGHDDAVVVTYKADHILPISYAYHPIGTDTPVTWTGLDTSAYRGHVRKVGTLIHAPRSSEYSHMGFSELFWELSTLTGLTRREIIERVSKITSLSLEHESLLPYKPTARSLPISLVNLINQKFHQPDTEFSTVAQAYLEERFKKLTAMMCTYLRRIFPGTVIICQPTDAYKVQFTFTFPTSKALLLFLKFLISDQYYSLTPLGGFLLSDTAMTRENFMRSSLEALQKRLRAKFPPLYDIPKLTALVQNAPSTK